MISYQPLLIGVGGYGLVELSFEQHWGLAFALKRQNMSMVVEKNHSERALLELKIVSEVHSPFILDCAYSYIDGKDLVLALRMLTGGDLAHYIKIEKDKAKKEDKPKTGLSEAAAKFYLASTLLGLEVIHEHGFVYRDLKDKNVLMDADGTARLCDFGLVHDLKICKAKGKVGTKVRGPSICVQLLAPLQLYRLSIARAVSRVCAHLTAATRSHAHPCSGLLGARANRQAHRVRHRGGPVDVRRVCLPLVNGDHPLQRTRR
jgi:serine/threonine protein kinase